MGSLQDCAKQLHLLTYQIEWLSRKEHKSGVLTGIAEQLKWQQDLIKKMMLMRPYLKTRADKEDYVKGLFALVGEIGGEQEVYED